MELQTLLAACPIREPITKGWSSDRKYRITDGAGISYLLRVTDRSTLQAKQTEFEMMQRVQQTGIDMCAPIAFGVTEEGVCAVHSWIDGRDLEEVLRDQSDAEQYRLGLAAGDALRRIHTVDAPVTLPAWETRFNRKIDRKIAMYRDCPLKYDGGEAFLSYIAGQRHLLAGRPQTFQHGDYHVGNMMLSPTGQLFVIDFNRADFGDPWEEFNRIVWSVQCSPVFASGCVDGYFDGEIPTDFWRLLALYICSNTLSSLPWAIPFGEEEIATMRRQAAEVLDWYDGMRRVIPTWYRG